MQLSEFLKIAAAVHADEWAQFARLCDAYWAVRLRGSPGLRHEDVEPEDVEVLVERFTYSAHCGRYIHTEIDALLQERQPSVRGGTEDQFEVFWRKYPRKVAKVAARKVWQRLVRTPALAEKVVAALDVHHQFYNWADADPRLIPHPATWLGQERWEDELKTAGAKAEFAGVV